MATNKETTEEAFEEMSFTPPQPMKDYEAAIDKVMQKAKNKDAFDSITARLFKFDKKGDALVGVYLGTAKGGKEGKIWQHFFGTKIDGRQERVFLNGTHQVSQAMKNTPVGTMVRVEFIEKVKAGQGEVCRFDIGIVRD